MSDGAFSATQLRGLIGQHVRHEGLVCLVIEVLDEGPSLVLEQCEGPLAIQNDQYDEPTRLAPRAIILPVWNTAGTELSAEFLDLEIVETR